MGKRGGRRGIGVCCGREERMMGKRGSDGGRAGVMVGKEERGRKEHRIWEGEGRGKKREERELLRKSPKEPIFATMGSSAGYIAYVSSFFFSFLV